MVNLTPRLGLLVTACTSFIAGIGCCLLFTGNFPPDSFGARRLESGLHETQLVTRTDREAKPDPEAVLRGPKGPKGARFQYVHKHTYATGDPKAAAYFVAKYFGGWCNHEPGHGKQHTHCKGTEDDQPITWNASFPATLEQPLGFSIHFVKNPHKLPAQAPMNETELGLLVEKWRGNFSKTGRFDQFMDSHLGLVFDTLDPLVEKWQRDGVPFLCRSWCCGPGMEQWPDRCPFGPSKDSDSCEQGCYVEVPHGIILEALCGMENYTSSRKCLTKVAPHQLKAFDLCSDNWFSDLSGAIAASRNVADEHDLFSLVRLPSGTWKRVVKQSARKDAPQSLSVVQSVLTLESIDSWLETQRLWPPFWEFLWNPQWSQRPISTRCCVWPANFGKRGHLSQFVLILRDRTQISLDCIALSAVCAIGPFGSNRKSARLTLAPDVWMSPPRTTTLIPPSWLLWTYWPRTTTTSEKMCLSRGFKAALVSWLVLSEDLGVRTMCRISRISHFGPAHNAMAKDLVKDASTKTWSVHQAGGLVQGDHELWGFGEWLWLRDGQTSVWAFESWRSIM